MRLTWRFILCLIDILPGPKPGIPRNLTVTEISNGFLITWQPPMERSHLIQYYTIKYKTDGPWKTLNKGQIRPEETSYLGKIPSACPLLFLSHRSQLSLHKVSYLASDRRRHRIRVIPNISQHFFLIVDFGEYGFHAIFPFNVNVHSEEPGRW